MPSGSAALYRREMLEEIGLFDESFFLYCEDTDLGLRARWAGWECLYVPDAMVEHRYSHSAGKASALKAYYVERNRLFRDLQEFSCCAICCWCRSMPCRATSGISSTRSAGAARPPSSSAQGGGCVQSSLVCRSRPSRIARAISRDLAAAPRDEAPPDRQTIPPPDPALLHQSASGGRAVKPAGGPHADFLILIPAFNEVGAIAGVIREVRSVVPEAPILVVDDASTDGTARSAQRGRRRRAALAVSSGTGRRRSGRIQTGV